MDVNVGGSIGEVLRRYLRNAPDRRGGERRGEGESGYVVHTQRICT